MLVILSETKLGRGRKAAGDATKEYEQVHNSIEPAPLGIEPNMTVYRKPSIATGIKSGCHVIDCLVKSFCVLMRCLLPAWEIHRGFSMFAQSILGP